MRNYKYVTVICLVIIVVLSSYLYKFILINNEIGRDISIALYNNTKDYRNAVEELSNKKDPSNFHSVIYTYGRLESQFHRLIKYASVTKVDDNTYHNIVKVHGLIAGVNRDLIKSVDEIDSATVSIDEVKLKQLEDILKSIENIIKQDDFVRKKEIERRFSDGNVSKIIK